MKNLKRAVVFDLAALAVALYFALPPPRDLIRGHDICSTTITDRHGTKLREVLSLQDGVAKWQPLEQISPYLIAATIVAEDKRFFAHVGVDLLATARALVTNLKAGRIVTGGSTLTQQLVHNIRAYPRRNLWYKLVESLEALKLEMHQSKSDLLEAYLNRVPYANQTFGAEAAAQLYFGKSCTVLSLAEAAFLAAIPRSPARYDPYRHIGRTHERSQQILRSLWRQRAISDLQYQVALASKPQPVPHDQCFLAPHFVDWLLQQQRQKSADCRSGLLTTEKTTGRNSTITTTLDLGIQQQVERLLGQTVRSLRGSNVTNGAVIVLRTGTNEVLALAGSVDYFDARHAGQVNAVLARRQPGSTLKPFTYELALEDGATAADLLPDLELHATERAGAFLPHNYDEQFHGPVRLRNALACSYNIPAVRVCEQVGTDRLLTRLRQLGFTSLDRPASHYGLALTLGSGDITLLELTRAYACLANGGDYQPEQTIIATENSRADRSPGPAARPVLPPWAAYVITDILADNSARIPAFGQYSALNLGFPCAAKTGTSKDYRDNWTVGYTTEYVVGVWIGNFDGSPMRGVSGITGAAPLFRNIMLFLHPTEPAPFVEPSGLCHQHICPKSGMCCGPDCPNSVTELFRVGTEPTQVCDVHQRYRLDRRTGLAAAQDTRPEDVEEVIFEVYPSLYYGWMQSVGLPFPPVCASSPDDLSPRSGRLAIVFPDPGSIFRIDPDLDPSFQAIQLEAEAPADCEMVSWAIDGELVATTPRPFQHFWPLSPGRHRIACAGPDGARAEVSILVLGPPERSPRDSAQVRSPDSDSLPAGFQGPGPWCPTGL